MAAPKDPKKGKYDASSISVLEGLDPVRKRPGMYIGTTGTEGLHHLVTEVFDNSRDEAMGGFANRVEVALLPGDYVRVVDNGRGIPVDIHKQTKVSALETILCTLHAGGKFGGENTGYKVSGGLHGVGVSVVNALSTHLIAEIHRDGGYFIQEYNIGKPKAKVKRVGASDLQGTIITFQADPTIFPEIIYDYRKIVSHLRQQAYLVKDMLITVIDARELDEPAQKKLDLRGKQYLTDEKLEIPQQSFYFEGGLRSLVAFNNHYQKPVHKNIFYVEKGGVDSPLDDKVQSVEVALQYVDDISPRISAFANNIYNPEHGTHITGFKTALTRTLNNYAKKNNFFSVKDKDAGFTGDDVLEGITAVVSVKMPDIQFEGQTKAKLGSVEARGAVESVFGEAFNMFLEENPDDAKAIINKVVIAVKARKAAKAAKDSVLRKGALEGLSLPGKLADCQSKRPSDSEIFIVEGDSAGGCFSGETKIALTDGRDLSLREIVSERAKGKKHFCYTINNNGTVAVGEVLHPRITKHNTVVVKVVLDTDEEVVCTPDHLFMLRDGSYKPAIDLKAGESLMPLYRKHSEMGGKITIDGYEMVYDPTEKYWRFTHLLSDQYNRERNVYQKRQGDHIHHRDFNKMLQALHTIYTKTGTVDFNHYEQLRKDTKDRTLIRPETVVARFFDNDLDALKEAAIHHNHRVVSVASLSESMDVYDFEVPYTHNFALASGVFVHNSAKMGRDRKTQAILPLRGKILNVERARIDKMLASEQIKNLVIAMGTAIGDVFDIEKLRYHKIIIATDADVDGAHIRTLLLTLFYRYFKPLIEMGYIYIAQPPLYKIQKGKDIHYAYSDPEKVQVLKDMGEDPSDEMEMEEESSEGDSSVDAEGEVDEVNIKDGVRKPGKVHIQRYKGLGEMNSEELWETTMNPEFRILKQVNIEDGEAADKVFDILMGTDVPNRKSFIQSNAKMATLDV
ncbi:hypothetical protein A2592_00070 [Candidatus Kaiserbacteria bacterium RIFOXYD1_FULL_42_15]|uniref:DNA topoisomerase (ATP-hydrolyzing) n=1 Tax=Candidatus Kaiserbacteria bacterium RIFOXYD1_FULL_42_15 TaxID=1798532 RepID=A0A1F6FQH9_9BACT|nr:MAG: hypothetical protein A2592_00070 [Candidatus Kaiserbacteria bacterium RIFOXYD1_FULL_42_15]